MDSSATPNVVSGEQPSFRRIFDRLEGRIDFGIAFLTTFHPRGGLQIIQPAKTSELLLKNYLQAGQTDDVGTWSAINTGRTVRVPGSSAFVENFLRPLGFESAAAAPLQSPLFEGYPGALHLVRRPEQGAFKETDLAALADAADEWQGLSIARRIARHGGGDAAPSWLSTSEAQFFAFNGSAKPILNANAFNQLDDELRGNMVAAVRQSLKRIDDQDMDVMRVPMADTVGDRTNYNVVTYARYPALTGGALVFVCRIPSCQQWGTLRATDVPADPEFARLVPASKFMRQEFHRSPSLGEIARSVHLSPFHFHRRFTEIMGLTPKHFMLECQIFEAKTELLNGTDLAKIAGDCGFAHQSHFTSRFKQATGLTPTRWRRTMRLQLEGNTPDRATVAAVGR